MKRETAEWLACMLVASVALVYALWVVPYIPTTDGPQHVLSSHIENHFSDPGSLYPEFYRILPQFAGKGFALIFGPLESLLPWRVALRVALSIIALAFAWGFALVVLSLDRAVERRPTAMLGFFIALPYSLYMGLFQFVVGSTLGLYILAFVLKQWSLVGVGSSPIASKMFFRLNGARAKLVQEMGGDSAAVDSKLATDFNTTEERIRQFSQRLGAHDASLDAQAFRDDGATFLDLLADDHEDQEEATAGHERDAYVRAEVKEMWGSLDERERLIVEERLLSGDDETTLADLGRRLGLSRERVRQLEERVKSKLRTRLAAVA